MPGIRHLDLLTSIEPKQTRQGLPSGGVGTAVNVPHGVVLKDCSDVSIHHEHAALQELLCSQKGAWDGKCLGARTLIELGRFWAWLSACTVHGFTGSDLLIKVTLYNVYIYIYIHYIICVCGWMCMYTYIAHI